VQALSKSRIIDAHLCPKRLWLKLYRQDLEQTSEDAQERFAVGTRLANWQCKSTTPQEKVLRTFLEKRVTTKWWR
jgi:hypothetical protein